MVKAVKHKSKTPYHITIIGAGNIGMTIAELLSACAEYKVTVIDESIRALERVKNYINNVKVQAVTIDSPEALAPALKGQFAVLNAAPFHLSRHIAQAAVSQQTHYLDLTEDVESTRFIKELASGAKSALIPQCGLAPGFISIAAYDVAKRFDELQDVHMRVGALPQYPSNALNYNLTWSTDGLINEYLNPCEAIVDGKRNEVMPLENLEHFSLDGDHYEAFNTSGGLGTLCETLEGKVKNLNYRTVRYPGHCQHMKFLLNDLRLGEQPELMKTILENAIPITFQDVVLIFITVSGMKQGHLLQETFARKIYSRPLSHSSTRGKTGQLRSAIQITTASSICTVLDLLVAKKVASKGFVKQESISLNDFLSNRFGRNYEPVSNSTIHHSHRDDGDVKVVA